MPPRKLSLHSSTWLLAALTVVAVTFGWCRAGDSGTNYLCEGEFALCTSAPCVPLPSSNEAVCSCEVLRGKSMAAAPCDTVQPRKQANGARLVYSMFSLDQFSRGREAMKCAKDTPWTWCLDKPCTVDPADPGKAVCICDIIASSTKEWMTLGGRCDTSTCETAYWSGASLTDFAQGTKFMQEHGQDIEPRWCE